MDQRNMKKQKNKNVPIYDENMLTNQNVLKSGHALGSITLHIRRTEVIF